MILGAILVPANFDHCIWWRVPILGMIGTIGTLMIINICYVLQSRIKTLLGYIGNYSLIILTLHMLSFRIVSYLIVKVYNLPIEYIAMHPTIDKELFPNAWIFYSLCGVAVPLLVQKIYVTIKRHFVLTY